MHGLLGGVYMRAWGLKNGSWVYRRNFRRAWQCREVQEKETFGVLEEKGGLRGWKSEALAWSRVGLLFPSEHGALGLGTKFGAKEVDKVAVYHLSAQFPGPTAPRDFVTLLITSSSALGNFSSSQSPSAAGGEYSTSSPSGLGTRHFMVISKPCIHPDCPPRDGFIRGQYESVEFIREIPLKPKKSLSATELHKSGRERVSSSSLDRKARLRKAYQEEVQEEKADSQSSYAQANGGSPRTSLDANPAARGRKRGRTISFAESRGYSAKGEAMDAYDGDSEELAEANPVEWIMVTRSDPGGSVPRFLVERGTPAGIVADASKFLDWAFIKEHVDTEDDMQQKTHDVGDDGEAQNKKRGQLEAYQTNGHLAGLDGITEKPEPSSRIEEEPDHATSSEFLNQNQQEGKPAGVANAAYNVIESYAPQVVIDHLPGHQQASSMSASASPGSVPAIPNGTQVGNDDHDTPSILSSSSVASFASAEDHFEDAFSNQSSNSLPLSSQTKDSTDISPQEKEMAKLNARKKLLDEKLAKTREKELKDKEELTSREEERLRKAEEKYAREIQKQEQKYKNQVARLEAKRVKDAAKEEERRRKADDKNEKARLMREKEELKQQLDVVCKERDILKEQVGALQKENTALVAKIGKTGEGSNLLREVRAETSGGLRSRSGSLRRAMVTSIGLEGSVPPAEKKE